MFVYEADTSDCVGVRMIFSDSGERIDRPEIVRSGGILVFFWEAGVVEAVFWLELAPLTFAQHVDERVLNNNSVF